MKYINSENNYVVVHSGHWDTVYLLPVHSLAGCCSAQKFIGPEPHLSRSTSKFKKKTVFFQSTKEYYILTGRQSTQTLFEQTYMTGLEQINLNNSQITHRELNKYLLTIGSITGCGFKEDTGFFHIVCECLFYSSLRIKISENYRSHGLDVPS